MTGFDYIVLLIVSVAAAAGFMRGFLQEILSLAAWIFAAFAIHYLHTPLTVVMQGFLGEGISTSILAFLLLLLIPYAVVMVIARRIGKASRNSMLAPIDRVLGFGFGALKGFIIVIFAFSLLVLGYDSMWTYQDRPGWITTARTYELIDSGSRSLLEVLAEQGAQFIGEEPVISETKGE